MIWKPQPQSFKPGACFVQGPGWTSSLPRAFILQASTTFWRPDCDIYIRGWSWYSEGTRLLGPQYDNMTVMGDNITNYGFRYGTVPYFFTSYMDTQWWRQHPKSADANLKELFLGFAQEIECHL